MKIVGFILLLCLSLNVFCHEVLSKYLVENISKDGDFEVLARRSYGFEVLVLKENQQKFLKTYPEARLLNKDINTIFSSKKLNATYRNYKIIKEELESIVENNSGIASLKTFGESFEKRNLLALHLTSQKSKINKPKVMITSATHGNEVITVEVVMGIINKIINEYKTNNRFSHILEKIELVFIPMVNPDGYDKRNRYAKGGDPNRAYPYPDGKQKYNVICINKLVDYFHSLDNVVASIDYHAYGELIMYPWAFSRKLLPTNDLNFFKDISEQMKKENNYKVGQVSHLLYIAKGSSADYYYWQKKTKALALEVARSFAPMPYKISKIVQENIEPALIYIESMMK